MKENKLQVVIALFIISILLLSACAPQTVEVVVTEIVDVTRIVEVPVAETVEVTRVVEVPVAETVEVTRVVKVEEAAPLTPTPDFTVEELIAEIRSEFESDQRVDSPKNCTVSPDGSGFNSMGGGFNSMGGGFNSMGGGTHILLDPDQYHGDYVYSTAKDTILDLQSSGVITEGVVTDNVAILVIDHFEESIGDPYSIADTITVTEATDSPKILLVQVNIDQFDTAVVNDRVTQAINEINDGYGIDRFVLNMSWIIVPCAPAQLEDVGEYIDAYCSDNIADDLSGFGKQVVRFTELENDMFGGICDDRGNMKNAIKNIGSKAYLYSLEGDAERMFAMLPNDPLYQFNACWQQSQGFDPYQESGRLSEVLGQFDFQPVLNCDEFSPDNLDLEIFPVAAAGNSSLDSSSGTVRFPFFPALWDGVLSVSALDGLDRAGYSNFGEVMIEDSSTRLYGSEELIGTSFAAPRISALAAVFLGQESSHSDCMSALGASFDTTFPALGYMSEGDNSNGFANLEVQEAADNYCVLFPVP